MSQPKTPVLLAILDGWGIGRDEPGNAVLQANTPNMDNLIENYPSATLRTSGEDVGLPIGQMGNSEVGHLNIGAGFIVYQWITRIDRAIQDGSYAKNEVLQAMFRRIRENDATLHLMGLIGEGGVHAHTRHLIATINAALEAGITKILVHAFTDGRAEVAPPRSRWCSYRNSNWSLLRHGSGQALGPRGEIVRSDRGWERCGVCLSR